MTAQEPTERGPRRTVLKQLERLRFGDAEVLLKDGARERRSGAMYLAGYGVECALKARICAHRGEDRLDPQFFNHDFVRLATATGTWQKMSKEWRERVNYLRKVWWVEMRYEVRSYDCEEVLRFVTRAKEFARWLSEN